MTLNKVIDWETDKTNMASVPDPPFFARGGLRQTKFSGGTGFIQ